MIFKTINQLDQEYKKRTEHLNRPQKKKPAGTVCWMCEKNPVRFKSAGMCRRCYDRIHDGRAISPDAAAYLRVSPKGEQDWADVINFYHRFFNAARAAGKTPQQFLTHAMELLLAEAAATD